MTTLTNPPKKETTNMYPLHSEFWHNRRVASDLRNALNSMKAERAVAEFIRLKMDTAVLRSLHRLLQPNIDDLKEQRQHRHSFLRMLRDYAEDGKVAAVESGRDCDCVEYSGRVHIIDATVAAYDKLYNDTAEWADGPFAFELMRPSEAQEQQYETRDLVLEAMEDGHRHVVYSKFGG